VKYVEAPDRPILHEPALFLAGGITGCPDWQRQMVELLRQQDNILPPSFTVFNPRRENFPIDDPSAAHAQIEWEYEHLRIAEAVSFWFPKETLCPIVLYELGSWSMVRKPIFVGVEPGYKREQDVRIQLTLARPEVEVVSKLTDLVKMVVEWATTYENGK
jgi:hypothetical protein